MDEIRDFLLSPQEYLDTFWESDVLIWIDWREYDESIIKYINEKLPEEDKVKFTCVEIEKERDVDIILHQSRKTALCLKWVWMKCLICWSKEEKRNKNEL